MMNAPSSERLQKSLHAARVIREDRVVHREGGSIYPSSASAVICQFELYHRISSGGQTVSFFSLPFACSLLRDSLSARILARLLLDCSAASHMSVTSADPAPAMPE